MFFFKIKILNVFHQLVLPAKNLHRLHHWQFHSKTQCAIACRENPEISCHGVEMIHVLHLYSISSLQLVPLHQNWIRTSKIITSTKTESGCTMFLLLQSKIVLFSKSSQTVPSSKEWSKAPAETMVAAKKSASWSLFWSLFNNAEQSEWKSHLTRVNITWHHSCEDSPTYTSLSWGWVKSLEMSNIFWKTANEEQQIVSFHLDILEIENHKIVHNIRTMNSHTFSLCYTIVQTKFDDCSLIAGGCWSFAITKLMWAPTSTWAFEDRVITETSEFAFERMWSKEKLKHLIQTPPSAATIPWVKANNK